WLCGAGPDGGASIGRGLLLPGHAVNTSVCARLRHPWVRTVPAAASPSQCCKPAANLPVLEPAFGTVVGRVSGCADLRDRVRQGCRTRAYRDVFTACPAGLCIHSGTHPTCNTKTKRLGKESA